MDAEKYVFVRGVSPELRLTALQLRRDLTGAERVLWEELRNRRLVGLKFRSQHAVGKFVLDFYCASCKLAIELDGSSHDNKTDVDLARTEILDAYGYLVLRFQNSEIFANLASVLERISQAASERTS